MNAVKFLRVTFLIIDKYYVLIELNNLIIEKYYVIFRLFVYERLFNMT